MAVLYLVEQGASLHREGECLVVRRHGERLSRVPLLRLEQVVIFGATAVTTPAMVTLMGQGVDVVFLSVDGRYRGRLVGRQSRFGELRLRQLEAASDAKRRFGLARGFLRGKLANQRTMLMRYARERQSPALEAAAAASAGAMERLDRAGGIGGAMAAEGYAAAVYFRAFREILRQDLGFDGRARRPPPDPVNGMLGFGYTLLAQLAQWGAQTVGLDPYIGLLHSVVYSRPSLALDLMEEFRPITVDSVVLRLVNTRRLQAEHFTVSEDGRGARLTEEGMRRFIEAWEARLDTRVQYGPRGEQVTYRRCIELQARGLGRVLMAGEEEYRPLEVK